MIILEVSYTYVNLQIFIFYSGYLLYYVKKDSNEIRWAQEKGAISHLFGEMAILEVFFIRGDSCVVPSTGFEPVAYGLEIRCSIQLSYEGTKSTTIQ
tara:strand:- start:520 stop:810 length:291 start_codon:yes stop_codon:yes gene_type:complete